MNEQEPENKERQIYQELIYRDDKGHSLTVLEPHCRIGLSVDANAQFIGHAQLQVHSPQGVAQVPFDFPIPADTLEEAFDKFEEFANARAEAVEADLKAQMMTPQILTPGPGGIIPRA